MAPYPPPNPNELPDADDDRAHADADLRDSSDVLDQVVLTVKARLGVLQPYLEEAARLEAILAATEHCPEPRSPRVSRSPAGSSKAAILAVIAEQPGVSAADIARMSGMKRTVVASTVSRLKRRGELEPDGHGVRLPRSSAH